MPAVSILMPTFRHGEFLTDAIASVQEQTFGDWELLVREDGPAPADLAPIADTRVTIEGQAHRGIWQLADTYNELLSQGDSEFVAILEGDDLWPASKLAQQLEIHRRFPEVVLTFGRASRIDGNGARVSDWVYPQNIPVDAPFDAGRHLLFGCPIPAVTVVVRRTALEAVGGFHQPAGVPAADYPTWLKLTALGPFYASSLILGFWRVHEANSSSVHIEKLARGSRVAALEQAPPDIRRSVRRHWSGVESDVKRSLALEAMRAGRWRDARGGFGSAIRPAWFADRDRARRTITAMVGLAAATVHLSPRVLRR